MKRSLTVSALILLGMSGAHAADNQELIDYRRHIMAALHEQANLIEMIAQKKAPAADFAIHAQALAVTASQAKQAFEPKAEGGASKPEVWSNWADFSKRLDVMTAATSELAKAAKSGGLAAATPKIQAAIECNSCHETYMKKKS
jgi:cytochrome c556